MNEKVARYLYRGVCVATLVVAPHPVHADPIGWPQPNGPGSAVYLTYSYSNLLDGGFNTVMSAAGLRAATEAAFGLWVRYAPIHLFEVPDEGPPVGEVEYSTRGTPDIRIGYESRLPEGELAHAHVPYGRDGFAPSGLSGDVHFTNDLTPFDLEQWGHVHDALTMEFFSTMVHEAGHALGLLHILDAPSVMGPELHEFGKPSFGRLFPADIAAIRALYGVGSGAVHPLGDPPPSPHPEPASMLLLAAGAGALLLRRR
jgi:hypothetical protein